MQEVKARDKEMQKHSLKNTCEDGEIPWTVVLAEVREKKAEPNVWEMEAKTNLS